VSHMRASALCISLVIGVSAWAQEPASSQAARIFDPAKRASIDELLLLMNLDQMQKQLLPQYQKLIIDATEKALPAEMQGSQDRARALADVQDFEKRLFDVMKDRLDFAKMKPEYVRLYDETFTAEEVSGIVAFYKTPAGKAYVAKLPLLSTKSVELSQRMLTDLMPLLQRMNEAWVEEMKKKYGGSQGK